MVDGKEPDDICYYLLTFHVVSVEFVVTLNRVETVLFKNEFQCRDNSAL